MDFINRFHKHSLKILKTVGQGMYGNVYLCEKKSGELTIIKDIEIDNKNLDHKKDIANEVNILSALNHPNIIRFYQCYNIDKYVMISMEYATKGSLAEYMFELCPKFIMQQEILLYFCQILLGVDYLHKLNIIHRDLKAENILLTGKSGVLVKIGDFGISKILESVKKTTTIIGTPYYLSPELCEGQPYGTKSDVWALGCLLYEMCTHKRAFESETFVGLIKAITTGSVDPINLSVYDRGIQDTIDNMLSVLPEKRPAVTELMASKPLLPMVYTVCLDAGNENFLYSIKTGQLIIPRLCGERVGV